MELAEPWEKEKPEYRDVASVMASFPFPGTPEFGEALRACRTEHGLTQCDVGEMVGASQQSVHQWECGRMNKKNQGGRSVYVRTWPMPSWEQLRVLVDRLGLGTAAPVRLVELDEDAPQGGMYSMRLQWAEEDERCEQRRIDELPERTRLQRVRKQFAEAMRHSGLHLQGVDIDRNAYECLVHIRELNPDYPVAKFQEDIDAPYASRKRNDERRMRPDVEGESGWATLWNQPSEGVRRGYDEEFGDSWPDLLSLVDMPGFDADRDQDIMEFCLRILGLFGMRDLAMESVTPAIRDDAYEAACSDDAGVFEDYPNGNEYEPSTVNQFLHDCASGHRHPWDDISALVISEQRKWREARLQEAAETLRNRIDWELGEILSMS